MDITLELNIALIPEPSLARRLAELSHRLAKHHPTIVQLSASGARLSLMPHLTLYQVPIRATVLQKMDARLSEIAHAWAPQHLTATGYTHNEGEASLETAYEVTDDLCLLQDETISKLNSLRGNLILERDPSGAELAALMHAPGKLGDNIRSTGYAEVGDPRLGGLFRPHATLNWFELGTQIDISLDKMPDISSLNGTYVAIGTFALGPNGTCPQLLTSHQLVG